jgi:hypothetical protein
MILRLLLRVFFWVTFIRLADSVASQPSTPNKYPGAGKFVFDRFIYHHQELIAISWSMYELSQLATHFQHAAEHQSKGDVMA